MDLLGHFFRSSLRGIKILVIETFILGVIIRLFKILKMFYPPKGLCEAEPKGVHLTVFPFYYI